MEKPRWVSGMGFVGREPREAGLATAAMPAVAPSFAFGAPRIERRWLRPEVDRLRYRRNGHADTVGTFLGHANGWAMMAVGNCRLPFCVRPDKLAEDRPVKGSVKYIEFLDGYVSGFESLDLGVTCSDKTKDKKPTAFGMGFSCGRADAQYKRYRNPTDAYNEHMRRLAAELPKEHFAIVVPPDQEAIEWPGCYSVFRERRPLELAS